MRISFEFPHSTVAATVLSAVLAAALLLPTGCALRARSVKVGHGFFVEVGPSWELRRSDDDAEFDLRGPNGVDVDLWTGDDEEVRAEVELFGRLIKKGDIEGRIETTTVEGMDAKVMLGIEDDFTGKRLLVAYVEGRNGGLGIQAAHLPPGQDDPQHAIAALMKDIGLQQE